MTTDTGVLCAPPCRAGPEWGWRGLRGRSDGPGGSPWPQKRAGVRHPGDVLPARHRSQAQQHSNGHRGGHPRHLRVLRTRAGSACGGGPGRGPAASSIQALTASSAAILRSRPGSPASPASSSRHRAQDAACPWTRARSLGSIAPTTYTPSSVRTCAHSSAPLTLITAASSPPRTARGRVARAHGGPILPPPQTAARNGADGSGTVRRDPWRAMISPAIQLTRLLTR
jgi:hypothetical protein